MSNMPPRMLSAPLRLTAMTLRSIGPYLQGARLEIKPLTVICGENGSGKSTWLEAVRYLKLATADPNFPLSVPRDLDQEIRLGINDALLNLDFQNFNELRLKRLKLLGELDDCGNENKSIERANRRLCGPPGTIGLFVEICGTPKFPASLSDFPELFEIVSNCSTLELRWATPKLYQLQHTLDGFDHWIELNLGGKRKHSIRMKRSLGNNPTPFVGVKSTKELFENLQSKEKYFTFEASKSLFDQGEFVEDDEIIIGFVDKNGKIVDDP